MKHLKQITFVFLLLLFSQTQVFSQNWQLVWSDEFTSGISADWAFETGTGSGGWGNNELEYYRPENAYVQNGQLVIVAKHESYGGASYTSARLKTQGKKSWKYGKIEARISVPVFSGVWPAFWMLGDNISSVGWPACGEMDIMETVNTENRNYGTAHWSATDGSHASYGNNIAENMNAFHVYSIEWSATTIKWFVDGVQYHIMDITNGVNGTSEFQNNFFILLNMAIGGQWPGFNIDNGAFPAYMYVDYVRVYQDGGGGGGNATVIEAENYSNMSGVQTEACTDAGGGLNVGYIDAGDWMAYSNINFPYSGAYKIESRVASLNGGGVLSADLNAGSIVLGQTSIPATGGWQNWTTVSQTVNVSAGTYAFGLYAVSGGFNINWVRITYLGAARVAGSVSPVANATDKVTNGVGIYPNPVVNEINVQGEDIQGGRVRVYDNAGRQVLATQLVSGRLNTARLKPGAYTLVITKGDKTITQQFIKQ